MISTKEIFGPHFTPLTWAVHNGHGEVVKILLGQEDVKEKRISQMRPNTALDSY